MSVIACQSQQWQVFHDVGHAEGRKTRLFGAEEFSGPSDGQVEFRNFKAVGGTSNRFESLAGIVRCGRPDEGAHAARMAATNTPSQLMELGKAESFGMFNHHHRRIGDIDADLDDDGGDEDIDLSCTKTIHGRFAVLSAETSVDDVQARAFEWPCCERVTVALHVLETQIGFVNGWNDNVTLLALGNTFGKELVDPVGIDRFNDSADYRFFFPEEGGESP